MSLSTVTSNQLFAGRYDLIREIGVGMGGGAAGQAFLARDTRAQGPEDELVVVKLSTYDSGAIYQVRTEARILQRLREIIERAPERDAAWTGRAIPVPWLFDGPVPLREGTDPQAFASHNSRVFLVEEYIAPPFVTLPELVRNANNWSAHNALELADALARLLDVAHRGGVIHGDLNDRKVEHIFWDPRGCRLKVIDWGIADDEHVVEQRHSANKDIQGLGTLFHYMLTGEPRGRGTGLPGWAERIVQSCLEQDPEHASLAVPRRLLGDALRQSRADVDARARELLAAVALPGSPENDERVRASAQRLAEVNPNHPVLHDAAWLAEGRSAIFATGERFQAQLAGTLALFSIASGEPANARASAQGVAARARELADQLARTRQLDDTAIDAFVQALPPGVVTIGWSQIASIFDLAARGAFTLNAPAGASAHPWISFERALRDLDLQRAADLVSAEPALVDPDPYRAALRAPELRYLLLAARFHVHPLTDIERHVAIGRVWSEVPGNTSAMSRAALERWHTLLGDAERAIATLQRAATPEEIAEHWRALGPTISGLEADSPGRINQDAPLDRALAVVAQIEPQTAAIAAHWRTGQYEHLGRAVDQLALDVPELADTLKPWTSGAAQLRECQLQANRLRDELSEASQTGSDAAFNASPLMARLETIRGLDPLAHWHQATRAALLTLADLTRHEHPAVRRLAWRALAELAEALATRRDDLADLAANPQLAETIQAAALQVAGPLDDEQLTAYRRDAAALGPLRPAFDAEGAAARGRAAARHAETGAWDLAARAFRDAADLASASNPRQAQSFGSSAAASTAIAASFAALVAGDFERVTAALGDAHKVANTDRQIAVQLADAGERIENIVGLTREFERGLRTNGPTRSLRQFSQSLRVALSEQTLPVAVRDDLAPILATCDDALGQGQQTSELGMLGRRLANAEAGKWRELVMRLLQTLPPPGTVTANLRTDSATTAPYIRGTADAPVRRERGKVPVRVAALIGGACLVAVLLGVMVFLLRPASTPQSASGTPGTTTSSGTPGLTAPSTGSGPIAERQADRVMAEAKALVEGNSPNADLAVQNLEKLLNDLDRTSSRRQDVEKQIATTLMDDSQRRVNAALELKAEQNGQRSRTILKEATERLDKAANLRPGDAPVQDGVARGREEVELAGLWLDFDTAYRTKNLDTQIAALDKIMARRPDYATKEGTAKEKLYAAWIAKAEDAWKAGQPDAARAALAEASRVDSGHPLAGQLQATWFPPTPPPVAGPPTAAPVPPAASKPVAPAPPAAAKPAAPVQPQQPAPAPKVPDVTANGSQSGGNPTEAQSTGGQPPPANVVAPVSGEPEANPQALPPPPPPPAAPPPAPTAVPIAKPQAKPEINVIYVDGGGGGGGNGGNGGGSDGGGNSNGGSSGGGPTDTGGGQ